MIYTGESTIENHKYTLPVVSIVTDPKNLWDPDTGIYVIGTDYAAVSGQLPTDITMTAGMQDPQLEPRQLQRAAEVPPRSAGQKLGARRAL